MLPAANNQVMEGDNQASGDGLELVHVRGNKPSNCSAFSTQATAAASRNDSSWDDEGAADMAGAAEHCDELDRSSEPVQLVAAMMEETDRRLWRSRRGFTLEEEETNYGDLVSYLDNEDGYDVEVSHLKKKIWELPK